MGHQLSMLPPELSPTEDVPGSNWVAVLLAAAHDEGYSFNGGVVGRYCKQWYDKFGFEPLVRAWKTWLSHGPMLGENPAYMNPKAFADKFGYWMRMSEPAKR